MANTKKPAKKTRPATRSTPKPTRAEQAVVLAAPAPAESAYSLEHNLARTGPSNDMEVAALVEGFTDQELGEVGVQVDTSRIDTDSARIVGTALDYVARATPEQKLALRGVTTALLRACAWCAVQGHDAYLALHSDTVAVRTTRQARQAATGSIRARARAAHLQLAEALRAIAAGDRALLARIDEAANQTNSADGLPGAIISLVSIGRTILQKPSASMKVRLAGGEAGLTEEWFDDCEDLAREYKAAGIVAESPLPRPAVTQAEVDRWDGINLVLLRRLVRVFEAAHAVDNTVPRLSPIALRGLWKRRGVKEHAQNAPSPQPPLGDN